MTGQLDGSPVRAALHALDGAGVAYCLRNSPDRVDRPEPAGDVDVVVGARDADRATRVLAQYGWHWLAAPGHRGHRFFVRRSPFGWLKIDLATGLRYGRRSSSADGLLHRRRLVAGLWIAGQADEARHRELRAAGFREYPSLAERIARRLPVGLRRRGCVVAVVGPDGAGKGTVLDGLTSALPVAVTRVYLGDPRSPKGSRAAGASLEGSAPEVRPSVWREGAWLARKAARLWAILAWAYVRAWRGHVVLCDRHPVDMAAVRPRRTCLGGRVERMLFDRLLPWPDALVVLDAPATVLYARKAEHDVAVLDRWRSGYLALRGRGAVVVSTQGTPAAAVEACLDVVWAALARRRGWRDP
jgi:thymidylate kinase